MEDPEVYLEITLDNVGELKAELSKLKLKLVIPTQILYVIMILEYRSKENVPGIVFKLNILFLYTFIR